nr:MAG TPA: hypothetical protein [Caudoviricetes sp.]
MVEMYQLSLLDTSILTSHTLLERSRKRLVLLVL